MKGCIFSYMYIRSVTMITSKGNHERTSNTHGYVAICRSFLVKYYFFVNNKKDYIK